MATDYGGWSDTEKWVVGKKLSYFALLADRFITVEMDGNLFVGKFVDQLMRFWQFTPVWHFVGCKWWPKGNLTLDFLWDFSEKDKNMRFYYQKQFCSYPNCLNLLDSDYSSFAETPGCHLFCFSFGIKTRVLNLRSSLTWNQFVLLGITLLSIFLS